MLTKTRHNKKRNTAFIYEALVRELTKCIVSKDQERKGVVVSLVKEHFALGTALREELELYRSLYENEDLELPMYEKLISEVKRSHGAIKKDKVFSEQTTLINKINKMLSKEVFSNFVPNYKDLATIYQILNPDVSVKHRVLLETTLAKNLAITSTEKTKEMAPMDNLVYKTFVKRFNTQYGGRLLEGQQKLLSKYIASFHDDGIEFKIFVNEELARLKNTIILSLSDEEIFSDPVLSENAKKVLNTLENYREKELDAETLQQVLKIQSLAEELRKKTHDD